MQFLAAVRIVSFRFKLEGGVRHGYGEVLTQAVLQLGEDVGGIIHGQPALHYHMGHDDGHAGRDGAGVQVVHGHHVRHLLKMFAHLVQIEFLWGFLQQHAHGVAQQHERPGDRSSMR